MAGLNKATLIGNLGKDPEIRTLNSGAKVATFSLATSESWTDKDTGEKKEHTDWHNIVVFNEHLVRVVEQYLAKGQKVYVEGQIKTRKWQDQSGQDRYTTEIVLQRFGGQLLMLSGKDGERRSGGRDDAYDEMDRERYGDRSRSQPRGGEVSSGRRGGSPNDSGHGDARKSKYADLDDEIPF